MARKVRKADIRMYTGSPRAVQNTKEVNDADKTYLARLDDPWKC